VQLLIIIMTTSLSKQISESLNSAGLRKHGTVLVHSSLRSLGPEPNGPETLISGLLDALSPNGTLLVPALSYEFVTGEKPVFDVRNTPSCVGAVSEFFRTRPGTVRSVHPTHSICGVGPGAEELLKNHWKDSTPCGPNSPLRLLRDIDGQLLFIGCGLKPNTSMHAVEELVEPPYLFGPEIKYQLIFPDGQQITKSYRSHNFKGWVQRYDKIESLLDENSLRKGNVLNASIYLIECRSMWDCALKALRRDPLFFIEKVGAR
jgi:aminoglycoside 3-N-acetyltransferase